MNCLLLVLLMASSLVPGQYRQYLEQGRFSEAMTFLAAEIRENGSNPAKQAACTLELGHFHRDVCGNFQRAAAFYRRVATYKLIPGHPLLENAGKSLNAIQLLISEYRDLDRQMRGIMMRSSRRRPAEEIKEDIERLKEIIRDNPTYYRLHEAHFALAANYEKLEKYYKTYRALDTAMGIKPGIVFYRSVKFKRDKAYETFIVNTVRRTASTVCWILLIVTILLFYTSRPWKWVKVRHLIAGILLVAAWWGIFRISHSITGWYFDTRVAPSIAHTAEDAEDKEFLYASPGSPGSEAAEKLFDYGLAGVLAIFVFSLGMRRIKRVYIRVIACGLFGLLLFTALSARYYLNVCYGQSEYESGYLKLDSDDPEPYVLTKPLAYPDLEAGNIRDHYVRQWVLRYCPFTQTDTPPHSEKGDPSL